GRLAGRGGRVGGLLPLAGQDQPGQKEKGKRQKRPAQKGSPARREPGPLDSFVLRPSSFVLHDTISRIGLAVLSTMRIGRPTLDWFCLSMSRPSARQMVPRKSCTETGRSSTVVPSALVLP